MKSITVSSEHYNSELAIKDVINSLRSEMPSPSAILIFTDGRFDASSQAAQEIYDTFKCPMAGCSTNGGSIKEARKLDHMIILVGIQSDAIKFTSGAIKNLTSDFEYEISREVIDPALCLIFPDALFANATPIIDYMRKKYNNIPITGAFPGDDWTFDNTLQYLDGRCLRNSATFMLLEGEVQFSATTGHGWNQVTELFQVQEVNGNVVSRIGNKTAYDFYFDFIGDDTLYSEFPLRFKMDDDWVMRAPLKWDKESGSITFGANIPVDSMASLASTTKQDLIVAARESAMQLNDTIGEREGLWLSFSCAARKRHLSTRAINERDSFLNDIVKQPAVFLYVYGEIMPSPQHSAIIQNQSIVHICIGEKR